MGKPTGFLDYESQRQPKVAASESPDREFP